MNVLDIARHNPGWVADRRNGRWSITRVTDVGPPWRLRIFDEDADGWHTWQVADWSTGRPVAGGRGPAADALRAVNAS